LEHCLPLNPRYQFDAFVIGQRANQFAMAAAQAVCRAARPKAYNPLFIYGASAWARPI